MSCMCVSVCSVNDGEFVPVRSCRNKHYFMKSLPKCKKTSIAGPESMWAWSYGGGATHCVDLVKDGNETGDVRVAVTERTFK